ncbi:MAG: hypothetical protein ACP5IE_06030 [Infirmifilum sp.]
MHGVVFTGYVEEAKIGAIDVSIGLALPRISDYAEVFSLYKISSGKAHGQQALGTAKKARKP